jgi:hypothetical protein
MSETGRGYCHRAGKVKQFEFVPMNQDVSRARFLAPARHSLDSLAPPIRRCLSSR